MSWSPTLKTELGLGLNFLMFNTSLKRHQVALILNFDSFSFLSKYCINISRFSKSDVIYDNDNDNLLLYVLYFSSI